MINRISRQNIPLASSLSKSSLAFFSGTYYDSQSGMHVPVHNDKEISVVWNISNVPTSSDSFVPFQLYKETSASDMPDKLQALTKQGIAGLWLPPAQFPRDFRNLKTLNSIAPPGFCLLASVASPLSSPFENLSAVHEFSAKSKATWELIEDLRGHKEVGTSTTLRLGKDICSEADYVALASQVATIIDSTGGGDFILLTPPDAADDDDVVELCEELIYLDLTGPTMQSRIMVESSNDRVIDSTMLIGINKYVVEDDSLVDLIAEIALAQGKKLRISQTTTK